jgi:hypothetical protein
MNCNIATAVMRSPLESESITTANREDVRKQLPLQPKGNISSVRTFDLSPADWQYTALQALLEQYTPRATALESLQHKQPITRQDFAIALQSLIAHIDEKYKIIPQSDLSVLNTLKNAFQPELIALSQRIDVATKQAEEIEKHQFSTTTKLEGEALFSGIAIGGNPIESDEEIEDRRITFGYRLRLNLITSFTGRDRLRLRFQSSSTGEVDEATGSDMARPSFQSNTDGPLVLNRLEYSFPIGKKTEFFVEAIGGSLSNFSDALNPYLGSSSRGSISRFGIRNPIYRQGGSTGIGLTHEFGKGFTLGLGYLADDANKVNEGLVGRAYGAIAQLTYQPNKKFGIGINYIRSFNALDTNTGSERANDPFQEKSEAIRADSFGLQSSIQIVPNVSLGGWVGLTRARALDLPDKPSATILNWAATLSLVDLGVKNGLAGIIIGQPPKVMQNQFVAEGGAFVDPDTSLHFEVFYRWPVRENIAVTVGALMVTNPEHNAANDTIYIGVVRTLFRF